MHSPFVIFAVSLFALMSVESLADDKVLQARVQAVLDEQQLVGAAWGFVSPGGEIITGAAGYANGKEQLPFPPDARFHVGSVAKVLLATGVLRLVSQGKLGLDDAVENHLPGIQFDNPWQDSHPVTIRHLLDHTAGLDDARLWQMFSGRIDPYAPLAEAFSRADNVLSVRARPGSRLSYSNTGYALLGMIVESVAGVAYEDYLDEHLLQPLGMHSSTFQFTTQEGAEADARLVWGHFDMDTPYPALPIMLRPAGQFTTTALDLAVFARFLMSDGSIDDESFIHPELMRARGNASTTEAAAAGLHAGYALGLSRWDRFGTIGYCHSGNIVGFMALLCIYPDAGKAFVVSVNTDSETANYSRLYETLAAHLDLPAVNALPAGTPAADVQEWEGWYRLEPSRFAQFAYLDELFGVMQLRWHDGMFALVPVQGRDRALRPVGDYLFAANDRATASHVLMRNEGRGYLLSDGYRTYERTHPVRLVLLWLSLVAGLIGLLWFVGAGITSFVLYRRAAWRRPEVVPFLAVLALLLSLPLFFFQSFVSLGDITPASAALALTTGLLPLLVLITVWRLSRLQRTPAVMAHIFFAVCVLQWFAVLAAWQMWPFRLWA